MPRQFRFGVSVWGASSASDWRDKARRAEQLGYDVLVTADHLAPNVFPPLIALTSVADATKMRIGTLVLNNDFRHPALVARDAATLDVLSEGRFELGIGAGHMESEYLECGIRFEPASTRIERLNESVQVIQRLLAGERLSFEGTHYQLREHAVFPVPQQQPLPLLIGGNDRRVLELAARRASIVGFTGFFPSDGGRRVRPAHFSAAALEDRIAVVRTAAAERFASLELHALVQFVIETRDRRGAAEALQAQAPMLSVEDILESPFVLLGTVDEMVDTLLARRARFGLSYFTVFARAMQTFAPVLSRLKGR